MTRPFDSEGDDLRLSPIPPHKFTRLAGGGLSPYEFEALGYVCAFTGLDPTKVTHPVATAFLALTYNLPYKYRGSAPHVTFLLRLSLQALSMFRRCEIERFAVRDDWANKESLQIIRGGPEGGSRGIEGELAQVLRILGGGE